MKNILLFALMLLLMVGCNKPEAVYEEDTGGGHGYNAFKYGEAYNTLRIGKRHSIDAGTVVININDDSDDLEVIFETNSDWTILKTHVYVGVVGSHIPMKRPGKPRLGRFPYKEIHDEGTTTFTHTTIPFISGQQFVVAAHAKLESTNKCGDNTIKHAWAYNEVTAKKFSCRGKGWFINYQYENIPLEEATILYGTELRDDSANIYHINISTEEAILISTEEIDSVYTSIDGNAWDAETNTFYFTTFPNGDLWSNDMGDEDVDEEEQEESVEVGELEGEGGSGAFYDGEYYYVDEDNGINVVDFDEDGDIVSEDPVDTIDIVTTVQDITISDDGLYIYGIGNGDTDSQFFKFEIATGNTTLIADIATKDLQIAFGADGILYAVDATPSEYGVYTVDPATGALTFLFDLDVQLSDLAGGPIL